MKNSRKRPRLKYDKTSGASIGFQEFGLVHYVVELLTPEHCRLMTRTLDDSYPIYRLTPQGETLLQEFAALCKRRDLWELDRQTFERNPLLGLPSLILRMQEAARDLLAANDDCKALPNQPEPEYGFPEQVWEDRVADANEALLAYQSILDQKLRDLHSMYTYG